MGNVYHIKFSDGYEFWSFGFPDVNELQHEAQRHGKITDIQCEGRPS